MTNQNSSREAFISCAAALAAAISLLERGGKVAKKAAPSDKMFDQMIADYRKALAEAREAISSGGFTREQVASAYQPRYVLEQIMNNSTDIWAKGVARTCLMQSSEETTIGVRSKFDHAFDILKQMQAENMDTMQSVHFGYVLRVERSSDEPSPDYCHCARSSWDSRPVDHWFCKNCGQDINPKLVTPESPKSGAPLGEGKKAYWETHEAPHCPTCSCGSQVQSSTPGHTFCKACGVRDGNHTEWCPEAPPALKSSDSYRIYGDGTMPVEWNCTCGRVNSAGTSNCSACEKRIHPGCTLLRHP